MMPTKSNKTLHLILNQIQCILAAGWRKSITVLVVLLGLCVFLGSEYELGKLIIQGQYVLAIIGILAISTVVIVVAYPFWGYSIWFFLSCYLTLFSGILPASFSFDLIMLSMLTIVLVYRSFANKEPIGKLSLAEVFLLLFFVYSFIVRREFNTQHLVGELKTTVLSPLFFYFITKSVIREKKHIYWLMIIILFTGVSFALMGFYEQITGKMWLAGIMGGDRGLYGGMRSTGPAGHYYVYGNMMIITILLGIHISSWQKKWFAKLACTLCAIIGLVGLYFGFSRAPYLAFFVSVILMVFLSKYTKKVYALSVSAIAIAAIILFPLIVTNSKIQHRFQGGIVKDTGRVATDKTSINMFKANPIFGVGKNQYQKFVPIYVSSFQHNHQLASPRGVIAYWGKPHSEYYLMLTELGLFGFLLCYLTYLFFVITCFRIRRAHSTSDVTGPDFAALVISFTVGVFVTMYTDEFSYNPYMYAVIFTLYAMITRVEYFGALEYKTKMHSPRLSEPKPLTISQEYKCE